MQPQSPLPKKILLGMCIVLVLICIVGSYFFFAKNQRSSTTQELHHELVHVRSQIEDRMNLYINGLYGIRGAYVLNDSLSRKQFERYVTEMDILRTYPGLSAFGFVVHVTDAEKQSFIKQVQQDTSTNADGYPSFHIFPETQRDEYAVLTYVEPAVGVESSLGFDFLSDPLRAESVKLARDSGRPVMTHKVSRITDPNSSAILISLPVYKRMSGTPTLAMRRESFVGMINAGLRLNDLFASLFPARSLGGKIRVEIFDGEGLTTEHRLFDSEPKGEASDVTPQVTETATLDMAQRTWTIRVSQE